MSDDDVEARLCAEQARILRALADRIASGDASLPTDVFQEVTEDLELRIDTAAIVEAWANEPEPPAIFSSKPPGGKRPASTLHPIRVFQRAERALEAIEGPDHDLVRRQLQALANDALPRGGG